MKYDFVDIGCCYYDTCVDEYGLESIGLLVEPVKEYYDVLPSSDTVKKECVAIGNINGNITFTVAIANNVKYISHDTVMEMTKDPEEYNRLSKIYGPILIGGWSSMNKNTIHRDVIPYCKDITVPCISFKSLMTKYNITEIDHLKIDVEGTENIILNDVLKMLDDESIVIKSIRFEYNELSDKIKLDLLIEKFKSIHGYEDTYVSQGFNHDCYLIKK